MKLRVHGRTMVVTPVILLTTTFTVLGASAVQQPVSGPVVLRAERGDTYLNLFGTDWQKAFRQNHITVIRAGRPLVSPDILVQDQILQVTGDVFLTNRALQRVRGLAERRNNLQRRLSVLASRGGEAGAKAVALRGDLDALRYAADIDYLEREADRLNSTPPPTPTIRRTHWVWVASGALLACVVLGGIALRRHRSQGPTGDARMRAALRDLQEVL